LFSYLNKDERRAAAGPSQSIRFPDSGPMTSASAIANYLIYCLLDRAPLRGGERGAMVAASRQLRPEGAFPIIGKGPGGLRILDRNGDRLYGGSSRADLSQLRRIPRGGQEPPLHRRRYLLDQRYPERNPAIEWNRFALAAAGRAASLVVPHLRQGGGSTLATRSRNSAIRRAA